MKHLKQIVSVALCLAAAFCMGACKPAASNGLMQNASPETSALSFFHYDGEEVTCRLLFETDQTRDLLDKLDRVDAAGAPDWSPEDVTLPVYGLEIGSTEGLNIFVAWSNGHWIAQDGTAYRFDYDFAALERDGDWSDLVIYPAFTAFPNARLLTQDEDGWNSALLAPAAEPAGADGVSMTLLGREDDRVTVRFTNTGRSEWTYGEAFALEVLLDGAWYEVPPIPGNWGFTGMGYTLAPGAAEEKVYGLVMYGDLPEGTYRLVSDGVWTIFEQEGGSER